MALFGFAGFFSSASKKKANALFRQAPRCGNRIDRDSAHAGNLLFPSLAATPYRCHYSRKYLPSGAGHDALMFDGITDIAMMFVRCGNGGISHSPLESITADDADAAVKILLDVVTNFKNEEK